MLLGADEFPAIALRRGLPNRDSVFRAFPKRAVLNNIPCRTEYQGVGKKTRSSTDSQLGLLPHVSGLQRQRGSGVQHAPE